MLGLLLPFVSLHAADPGDSGTAIPFSEIGAKARADYKGDAIGVTQTKAGAQLWTGFQKLEAEATSEGLWLRSTSEAEGGRTLPSGGGTGRTWAKAAKPRNRRPRDGGR